ncbi:MAG: hypothetical protein ABI533_07175, partial [Betaproteobacteria bacterium]
VGDLMLLNAPRYARPMGVRAVDTMTASLMQAPADNEQNCRQSASFVLRCANRGRSGDVAAITGFTFTSLNLNARGIKDDEIEVMPYPKYGVNLYGNVIIVSEPF